MAFDISRLTSAVNKYLNSISDAANAAKTASTEIEARTQFSVDLKEAIRQNMESRSRDAASMPDIASRVKEETARATEALDSQIQQINGSFEAIREAGTSAKYAGEKDAGDSATASNHDAYKGTLSPEALKELSQSRYFSANLIRSALFEGLDGDENGSSQATGASALYDIAGTNGTNPAETSPFNNLSLSDINMNSLLQASGLENTTSSSDLADALIKAYKTGGSAIPVTSIFGDFSL